MSLPQELDTQLDTLCPQSAASAHYIASTSARLKKGSPGAWNIVDGTVISSEQIMQLLGKLTAEKTALIEQQNSNMYIIQYQRFRIIITSPPLSTKQELTVVRSSKLPTLEEYKLPSTVLERLSRGRGVLVAGAPGHGKSTFVSAVIQQCAQNNIVKTVESPRDLVVPNNVTQLTHSYGNELMRDILLLSRPDVVCIDEIRHKKDAVLFADLRLCGIGCFGVIHATKPVDAIARFSHHVGLGELAHTLDTVIYIQEGKIKQVLDITLIMKVPEGLKSKDLTRPVVLVKDLDSQQVLYELFSFADQIIIHDPQTSSEQDTQTLKVDFARQTFALHAIPAQIECKDGFIRIEVSLKDREKSDELADTLQDKLQLPTQVIVKKIKEQIPFVPVISQHGVSLRIDTENECTIYVDNAYLLCGKPSKKGAITIRSESEQAKKIVDALRSGKKIEVFKND